MPDPMIASYWMATTADEDPPGGPLPAAPVDVVVVGAGILGLLTAYRLAGEGLSVAVIERGVVGGGVTGRSTAKVTALHGAVHQALRRRSGPALTAAYASANQWGVEEIARIVADEDIRCGWAWASAVTYATGRDVGVIEDEILAAGEAGLPVKPTGADVGLPRPVGAGVELAAQGMVNPRRLCLGLVDRLSRRGVTVTTECTADGLDGGRVSTSEGPVTATRAVVLASHLPFLNRGGQFATTRPSQSYVIAAEESASAPNAMLLGLDDGGVRSVRRIDAAGAGLLIAGEGHITGRDPDTARRHAVLEQWGVEHLGIGGVTHRWSAHDYVTAKGFPSVGPLPFTGDVPVFVGTGFAKWGFSNSAAAARIITDLVVGRAHPWPELASGLGGARLGAVADTVRQNLEVAGRYVGDRLASGTRLELDGLQPGDGAVGRWRGRRVAVHRSDDGNLTILDARCTHLGCIVQWNGADRSWDCPCHGSRFTATGAVFDGPATADLEPLAPDGSG